MPSKKKAASKTVKKKATTSKAAPSKPASKKADKAVAPKSTAAEAKPAPAPEPDEKAKALVLGARRRSHTPSMFKVKKGKTPVVFTMEDVAQILKSQPKKSDEEKSAPAVPAPEAAPAKKEVLEDVPVENREHGAASLADILGFNPAERQQTAIAHVGRQVPRKWQKNYKLLLELREHVTNGLELHTADTLKRSNREDSGDLSGYGQHMADAGTDTFDRDFALSLVSNEQEALYEIEEAIQRIFDGSYGTCEHTGEEINPERLLAVPFTRYSLEGQRMMERQRRSKSQRGGVFTDNDDDLSLGGDDDDN